MSTGKTHVARVGGFAQRRHAEVSKYVSVAHQRAQRHIAAIGQRPDDDVMSEVVQGRLDARAASQVQWWRVGRLHRCAVMPGWWWQVTSGASAHRVTQHTVPGTLIILQRLPIPIALVDRQQLITQCGQARLAFVVEITQKVARRRPVGKPCKQQHAAQTGACQHEE